MRKCWEFDALNRPSFKEIRHSLEQMLQDQDVCTYTRSQSSLFVFTAQTKRNKQIIENRKICGK